MTLRSDPAQPVVMVDEFDRPLGLMPRGQVEGSDAILRSSHAVLFDRDGRVILQRLGDPLHRNAGMWGSSAASFVHTGESYHNAVERALITELGVVADDLLLVGVIRLVTPQRNRFVGVFEGTLDAWPQPAAPHVAEVRAFSLEDLRRSHPSTTTPALRSILSFLHASGASRVGNTRS